MDDLRAPEAYFSLSESSQANCICHRWMERFTDSVMSPSDSLDGAHAHAINTRPPRGAGSEAKLIHTDIHTNLRKVVIISSILQ